MSLNSQLTILIIDKLVIGVIVLMASMYVTRNVEKFKNEIVRKNKISDEVFKKISFVVESIWDCNLSLEKMLANFAKKNKIDFYENFDGNEDSDYSKKTDKLYIDSAAEFSEKVSSLTSIIKSNRFWLDDELSELANEISDSFNNIIYGMINKKYGKAAKASVENINDQIKNFELKAKRKLDQT